MNYIYSLFKRLSMTNSNVHSFVHKERLVLVLIMVYAAFALLGIPYLLRKFFHVENDFPEYVGAILFGCVIVYPLIYALIPGYRFIESVKEYSIFKTVVVLIMIVLSPAVVMILATRTW